ncbi:MAG: PAS domain-containing sensor histidine kinase [Promethearchaeota archaeon]
MTDKKLPTKFAPAERASEDEIKSQVKLFEKDEILSKFLGKIPAIFIIINKHRQIVYMNRGALEFTGLEDLSAAIGKRPGELFGCLHASEEEGGCGTTEGCTWCGAVNVVLSAQKGNPSMRDCRLILGPNEISYDLRIWASPLEIKGDQFTAVTIQDISHEKRRAVLERVFFHDILNTTTGLYSIIQLIQGHCEIDRKDLLKRADYLTRKLIDEIQSQRILNAAENDNYTLNFSSFNSIEFLNEVINLYKNLEISENKIIRIDSESKSAELSSDRTLLRRVIGNMLMNALEATPEGNIITLGCKLDNGNVQFWVHNPGFIPREVQMQIFQRSFSTKDPNRGVGTYSMKLLSSFLKGTVNFSTSEEKGTIFKASYPKNPII